MREPSAEWTLEERLAVIAELSAELMEANRTILQGRLFNFDLGERIYFVATKPATFLEANREAMLKGQAG